MRSRFAVQSGLVLFAALFVLAGCAPAGGNPEKPADAGDDADTDADEGPDASPFDTRFSQPRSGQPDKAIEDAIVEYIEAVPDDGAIRAAFYTFGQDRVANALSDAHDRGVDVRVVLGNTSTHAGGSDWSAVDILRDNLGDRLTICQEGEDVGGCMGDNIQHNKFIALSKLDDGSRDVVLQTSANLTEFQLEQFNNLVIIRDDRSLYEAVVTYWQDLQRDERDLAYDRDEMGDQDLRIYFFPLSSGDPVLDRLAEVDCAAGADVYLAMAFFTDARSSVADRLREMDEDGCGVHVLLSEEPEIDSPGRSVVGNLENGDIDYGIFRDDEDVGLHSKYLLVDGAYGPDGQERRIVWTGSHNLTRSALRSNDEILLEIEDDQVFDDFYVDWHHMRHRAESVHP